jgi:hypothetical protein
VRNRCIHVTLTQPSNFYIVKNNPILLIHDSDIIRKFEKAIVELTQGKISRWETRFVALYSKKDIDIGFLVSFNLQFQRRSKSGGGGNFNFANRNCSDSVDFILKKFFPEKMVTPHLQEKIVFLDFSALPASF